MIGENRQLVTDEPVSLRNNRLKFKMARELPIILEEYMEYIPYNKKTRRMSTCKRLGLQTLGSQWVMPQNLPHHWLSFYTLYPNI